MKLNWGLDEPTTRLLWDVGLIAASVMLALAVLGISFLRFWPATTLAALVIVYYAVVIIIIARRMVIDRSRREGEAEQPVLRLAQSSRPRSASFVGRSACAHRYDGTSSYGPP